MTVQKSNIFVVIFLWSCFIVLVRADYKIGVGRADCTGPSAEIVFMGYAKSGQTGCGIHLRQFARAFVFDDGTNHAAYVTIDACMMNHGVRRESDKTILCIYKCNWCSNLTLQKYIPLLLHRSLNIVTISCGGVSAMNRSTFVSVLRRLSEKYGDTYTVNNLILSGTHTHGAPGGFLQDLMLDIPNFGFVKDTFDALVEGITNAITKAHDNMVEGKIYVTSGELLESNINRSPASYLYNPEEERAKYPYNVDKDLVQLKFIRSSDNELIGAINWFAVHPTSMNNSNCLVTSDNVGYASILFEGSINEGSLPGEGSFVGAFASTNLGDVSPNTKGPRCINTGELCDNVTSTCDGQNKYCIAFGPGDNMFESTEIIAGNLFNKAKELLSDTDALEVTGPVKYIHQYVDMPKATATITLENGTEQEVHGCLPAMGYGFAAGTTDGPGEFDFAQGTTTDNPFWNAIRDFVFPPTPEDIECQFPKPILIASGRIELPYEWQPQIVATQILLVGNVALTAVPGEFTTMSGRRMRDAVKEEIIANGGSENTRVIITGLSNVYTNYIATPEEYQLQRYEGGSTIFGPHTLTIYLKQYRELAAALLQGKTVDAGPTPPDFSDKLLSLVTPVLFDTSGWINDFGDCLVQPPEEASAGDIVSTTFVAGHPRNDVMHGKTFLTVEKLDGDNWTVVATDANWETKFIWTRTAALQGTSEVEIQWEIKDNVEAGTYRIGHFGNYKYIGTGGIFPYQGYTRNFKVV